ncbi:MAG: AMP-binding protein [Solirubrobacteraceae bacterium]
MNVACWLQRAALSSAESPAIAVGEKAFASYGQLARRAASLARGLRDTYGLQPGDRVAIAAKNHPSYFEALFAIWWAGLVAVPVNAKLHESEIAWIVEHAGARAVFCSKELEAALGAQKLQGADALICFGGAEHERLAAHEPMALTARSGQDVAWLFYTSGTTGRPKGAMLTHHNLVAMSLAHLVDVDPTLADDALLHCAPLSHGSGLLCLPHVCRLGVNVIPESGGFEAAETIGLLRRWKRASLFAAPTMVRRLVEAPQEIEAAALRSIVWGGAPMHVADTLRALERLGPCLVQVYGQGESPMTITALAREVLAEREHPRWQHRLASAGTVRSVVEMIVANDQDEPLPAGELGEVLVRGETLMAGYWRDQDASEKTLRGGWLHTGDVGVLDEDGYLTLMDRSKDLIISGGTNIYPREVEEVLMSHPGVREVSVIGRADPDWGEVVVAYVAGEASPEELDRLCLERIARFKRPKDYVFVPSLPKSNYGKVLKTTLREQDAKRSLAQQAASASDAQETSR